VCHESGGRSGLQGTRGWVISLLIELDIANFAIIDHLRLGLGPGFNALTGETGAGKSIIIDAVGALLGQKIGAEFIRSGQPQAHVEGLFDLSDLTADHPLFPLLRENGLADEAEIAQVIVSRDINASGRSVARINGRAVSLAIMQKVGEHLIDIHGQNEHASLLRSSEHIELLDQYAGLTSQREHYAAKVATLRAVRRELHGLQKDERELARRADLLTYQVEEIEKAGLRVGEDDELVNERQLLSNAERLDSLASAAYTILYESSDEAAAEFDAPTSRKGAKGVPTPGAKAVIDALNEVAGAMAELARYDSRLTEQEATITTLVDQVNDLAKALRHYRDGIEHDPARLEYVEERISLFSLLKRKYGPSLAEIIEFGQRAASELDGISHSEERVIELQAREDGLLAEIGAMAAELTRARRRSGDELARAIERSMADLNMARVQIYVAINHTPDRDGVALPPDVLNLDGRSDDTAGRYAFNERGVDKVEFLLASNPGEPLKPLAKIASGGETSRLMLAIKAILSAADATPTLIFDEVDVGVGGRSGQVVGEKLWSLTDHHQVICISHLPQIAAFGDQHFKISKQVNAGRTSTHIDALNGEERVHEVAAMIGGPNPTAVSLENARQIIRQAEAYKSAELAQVG